MRPMHNNLEVVIQRAGGSAKAMGDPGHITRRGTIGMRRAVAGVFVIVALLPWVGTGGASAAKPVYRVHHHGIMASGWTHTQDQCSFTDTYLQASGDSVSYSFSSFDCDHGRSGYGEAAPSVFRVTPGMDAVEVVATIPVTYCDSWDCYGPYEITISETFTATGPIRRERDTQSVHVPGWDGYMYRYSSKGAVREATATGSIELDSAAIGRYNWFNICVKHSPRVSDDVCYM